MLNAQRLYEAKAKRRSAAQVEPVNSQEGPDGDKQPMAPRQPAMDPRFGPVQQVCGSLALLVAV